MIARISYATRMTNSGLIQIHAELEESAQMSGATAWQALPPHRRCRCSRRRCSMPGCGSRCSSSASSTLAVILSTADNITFPVVVWSLWLGGGLGQASALAIVMLLMMAPPIALYWLIARRQDLWPLDSRWLWCAPHSEAKYA